MIESTSTIKQRKVEIPNEPVREDVDDASSDVTTASEVPQEQKGLVSRLGSGLWNYSSVNLSKNLIERRSFRRSFMVGLT